MRKLAFFVILFGIAFLATGTSFADVAKPKSLEAIELRTGFGWGDLRKQDDYNLYPLKLALDFNLKPLTKKFNFNPSSLLQFQIEPFAAFISSPSSDAEIGTSFFLKAGILPQTSKFQPYIKVGVGLDYMTLHTSEQSTQFNFISTGAVGMHYFFKQNIALTLEGSYRHLSNAGIDHPNTGINATIVDAGILYQF